MKFCPICKTQYPEDANFCPQETCATPEGPQRLQLMATQAVGRFQPIEKIGGGRTGEVWRARDSQTGQEVAYKSVMPAVVSTPAALARMEREFRQLMRVSNPKVATVLDCEKTPIGGLAIATELCPGDSLERILAAGHVDFEQAKSIVAQVGQALLEAQKVGLVHRDVAPKNILVSASGDVKVINFPLAVPINEKVSGVAAYLSPEQVQGKPVDQRFEHLQPGRHFLPPAHRRATFPRGQRAGGAGHAGVHAGLATHAAAARREPTTRLRQARAQGARQELQPATPYLAPFPERARSTQGASRGRGQARR